jgi:hypothetical protein
MIRIKTLIPPYRIYTLPGIVPGSTWYTMIFKEGQNGCQESYPANNLCEAGQAHLNACFAVKTLLAEAEEPIVVPAYDNDDPVAPSDAEWSLTDDEIPF